MKEARIEGASLKKYIDQKATYHEVSKMISNLTDRSTTNTLVSNFKVVH